MSFDRPPCARIAPPVGADGNGRGSCPRRRHGDFGARVLIAADGRNSSVRHQAGIRVVRRPYNQVAIVCTIAHERPHDGVAQERFLTAGPFAILPMTGNRSSLVWTERADLAPAMLALDDAAFLDEVAWRFTDYLGELSLAGPRWSYPLELSWATRTVDRRLVLVGDAAHSIHPIAGQGLNLGLRDVAALAEVLVDAHRLGFGYRHQDHPRTIPTLAADRCREYERCDRRVKLFVC